MRFTYNESGVPTGVLDDNGQPIPGVTKITIVMTSQTRPEVTLCIEPKFLDLDEIKAIPGLDLSEEDLIDLAKKYGYSVVKDQEDAPSEAPIEDDLLQ